MADSTQMSRLLSWVDSHPIILMRCSEEFHDCLINSRRGLARFTFTIPRWTADQLHVPTLCLVEMDEYKHSTCYAGVVLSKRGAATTDILLATVGLRKLKLKKLSRLTELLEKASFQTSLEERMPPLDRALGLTPKLSVAVVNALCGDDQDRETIEAVSRHISSLRRFSLPEWEQFDAIRLAMTIFGLSKHDAAESLELRAKSDSTLDYIDAGAMHILEDNVIARDARRIPGFTQFSVSATGKAVFVKDNEKLIVYTANRGPLEAMVGVDLIYISEKTGNSIMVQYKMLEATANSSSGKQTAWLYRPDDKFWDQLGRMKLPFISVPANDYRMHPCPFFFKFVKRKGDADSPQSYIVALEHLQSLLKSDESKGKLGGLRISFNDLDGLYLRESDLIGLLRSGYIGTHRAQLNAIAPFIEQAANGNRAAVIAWHKSLKSPRPK